MRARTFGAAVVLLLVGRAAHAEETGLEEIFPDDFENGICAWTSGVGFPQVCPYDFFCAGDVPPVTAPAVIGMSGVLGDLISGTPISGATVEARRRSNNALLDSDTTAVDGSFALSVATGDVPVDAYLSMSASSYPATYLYPPDPASADVENVAARAITSSALGFAYLLTIGAQTPGTGTNAAIVIDCAGTPITGATASFDPAPGALRYLASGIPSGTTSTDDTGIALGMNAPPGVTTVNALYLGIPLESHTFEGFNGGVSVTLIHP